KWGTVEVDYHGESGNDPETNWRAARGWYDILVGRGFCPLLWDSNGAGGYHLHVLLPPPVPPPHPFFFLPDVGAAYLASGLCAPPETFPKQSGVNPTPGEKGHLGNWVRVIGRHHTRDHWALIWDGERWLGANRAIDYILDVRGDDPRLIPALATVPGG